MLRSAVLLAPLCLAASCKSPESTPPPSPSEVAEPAAEPKPQQATAKTYTPSSRTRTRAPRVPKLTDEPILPGDTAYTNDGPVFVAATKEAYERLDSLALARDEVGINQLVLIGMVWTAPKYRRCKIIDLHGWLNAYWEVRLLDGPHAGRLGFIARSNLSKGK